MAYVPFELPDGSDPETILAAMIDYFMAAVPGWTPIDGHPEVALMEAVANAAAEDRALVAEVGARIFRHAGEALYALPQRTGAPATATATFTLADTNGHTVYAGTTVLWQDGYGGGVTLSTVSDAVAAPGTGTLTDVIVTADVPGVAGNAVAAGPAIMVDSLSYVSGVTLTSPGSGGVDEEPDLDYIDRLATFLRGYGATAVTATDFALLARNIAGVDRAVAIDGWNPTAGTTGNEKTVGVVVIDENGAAVSVDIRNEVDAYLQSLREINFIVIVANPTTFGITVLFTVTADPGRSIDEVIDNAEAAAYAYLSPATWGEVGDGEWVLNNTVSYLTLASIIGNADGVDELLTMTVNGGVIDVTMTGLVTLPSATVTGSSPAITLAPNAVASATLTNPPVNVDTMLDFTWTAPATGPTPSGYRVGWTEAGTGRQWNDNYLISDIASAPLRLNGLLPSTSYDVTVTPFNGSGDGPTTTRTEATQATPGGGTPTVGKKIIKLGQDMPSMSQFNSNKTLYDGRPFDGWVVNHAYSSSWLTGAAVISQATFATALSAFPTGLVNSTHNWVRLINTYSIAMDWFDNSLWTTICTNIQNLAAAIAASGRQFVGIFLDLETYGTVNIWNFGSSGAEWSGSGPGGQTANQMRDIAIQRGNELMDAAVAGWSTAKIWTTYGPPISESLSFTDTNAYEYNNDVAFANELMGSFAFGIAQSTFTNSGTYLDGCEHGYEIRTAGEALQYRNWAKTGFPDNSTRIILGGEKATYKTEMRYMPAMYDLDQRAGTYALLTPAQLQQYLIYQRDQADEYYWCYTEYHEWGNSLSGKPGVTQGYLDAISNAKSAP